MIPTYHPAEYRQKHFEKIAEAEKAQRDQANNESALTDAAERKRLRDLWEERSLERSQATWGFICMECTFVCNHQYPGFAMDEVRTHCLDTNHLVVLGTDINNHPITKGWTRHE